MSDRRNPWLEAAQSAVDELRRLAARREALDLDIRVTRAHVDDIRTSRSWRALEIYRRARARAGFSGASVGALQAALRARRAHRRVPARVRTAPIGVNVSGYLDTESGMGQAARASIRALEAAGVPLALNNVISKLRAGDATYRDAFADANPHPFNLVHLNADNMPAFAARRGRKYFADRYTIGYWFWELSVFRDEWVPFAGYVDEVWTATHFVRDAVAAKCAVPVHRMRLPIVLPAVPPKGRAHFGIPEGPRVFLYIFDVSSQTERKNPLGAIRAFRQAQLPASDAVLVLKFSNPEYDRAGVRRLHEEARGLNIVMLDGYLDRPSLAALLNLADCYLSPHRSEGYGMTLLESMALGKAVIGTAYSGTMDFMTPDLSYPLDHTLVTITRDYGPYMRGAVWADPDLDQAARFIREIVASPHEAAARGARAKAMVESLYSPAATGAAMRARLEAIRAGRRNDTTTRLTDGRRERVQRREPGERSEPAKRRASETVGESEGRRAPRMRMMVGQEQRERLEAATRRLAAAAERRVAAERLAVAAMEQESRQLHDEYDLMESSAGRRLFFRVRGAIVRAGQALAHPVWTAGSVVRRVTARPSIDTAARALTYLASRSSPLRLASPVGEHTDQPDDFPAIRWIGPIAIRSRTLEALLCHPNSSIEYRVTAPAGSAFVTSVALSPHVWRHGPAPVDFTVTVSIPATGWSSTLGRRIDARRITARKWHGLRIPMPETADPSLDVVVRLETTATGPANFAWALFGEPRIAWRRPAADVRRSLSTFASQVRVHGFDGALALLRRAPTADEDAERYARWVAANTHSDAQLRAIATDVTALPYQPLISIITPVYNTDPRWLRACVESVRRQVYPNWELCLCDDASPSPETAAALREFEGDPRIRIVRLSRNEGISGASNAALAAATGEYVALLDHDDELTPDALAEVVRYLNAHPGTDLLYSDEDKLDEAGRRCDACFKPDWSPEHFLHRMYTCHLTVMRRAIVEAAGGFRKGYEGSQDYDLWLRAIQQTDRIGHIPRVLYHWRKLPQSTASAGAAKPWAQDAGRLALQDYVKRAGLDAEVLPGPAQGLFRVRRRIAGRPLVSIVIPTAGRMREVRGRAHDLLAQAIRAIAQRTEWPEWEIVIVSDPAGLQPPSIEALAGTRHRVIAVAADGPFNFSRKINAGVAASGGEHVLLFNDDMEPIDRDWMTAMLEYSQDPAIGAVGAQLLYPDGRLQHVGMLMGVAGIAAHAYHQHPGTTQGYFGSVIGPRNFSAVTAACLMTRRAVFDEAGGFDETFPIDFNDVDYCLRVRRAGYRIVYTPYARLYHHESASFGARQQDQAGIDEMRRRWGGVIADDPYYNRNLTREFPDYRLRT